VDLVEQLLLEDFFVDLVEQVLLEVVLVEVESLE
jgi:hypothetical protein